MIINPFGNKEPDPVFESLTNDLEYVIVRRDFILPVGMLCCVFGSAAWFYELHSAAAFLSALTGSCALFMIYARIKINLIAEALQKHFEEINPPPGEDD
jgi:hypothetical protein